MDCGGRNSGVAHPNGDLMQIADYISSSIEASNGGLLVTVYFQVPSGVHTIAVAS
jgi:hypothetical protein